MIQKKIDYYISLRTSIQHSYEKYDLRTAYRLIRKLTGINKRRSYASKVKDKNGNLLHSKNSILHRWHQYFTELLQPKVSSVDDINKNEINFLDENDFYSSGFHKMFLSESNPNLTPPNIPDTPPSLWEIQWALNDLRNNSSPGNDKILPELLKYGGEPIQNMLLSIFRDIWSGNATFPYNWNNSLMVCIHKKKETIPFVPITEEFHSLILLSKCFLV